MMNRYRILILEDNPRIRRELTVFLESNGFACTAPQCFENLVEALLKKVSGIGFLLWVTFSFEYHVIERVKAVGHHDSSQFLIGL